MNKINTHPVGMLGYNFVEPEYLQEGQDEYHLRNIQNNKATEFRNLTGQEIEVLIRNGNVSDNWNNIKVGEPFNPSLIRNCEFYGLIRVEALEPMYKEFHDFRMAVGFYNSIIISCDFGRNCCIDNVRYLSHYIVADEVMIANVNELATTRHAKFGNGIIKEGETEKQRVWLEVSNENGGRAILPFNGMLPGDAYLWSRYRSDKALMDKFIEFTNATLDSKRGYYGKIGDRTIIKNTDVIKDVWIGSDCYIKGANKLKNLTINSDADRTTQIGEGCELVNGIIGFGCRIFYGVKAVRFLLSSHSQLKYGARLINSFLGNNSTISCCEVLNSLIFPTHEQHHNNSFLCAALIMGQSNLAAGATIGSNHNSRAADGEMIAGRGFWPGLCVSIKHNSRFASYTILAKGDYQNELDNPLPFSLISLNLQKNCTEILPAYWFVYNAYGLCRNSWKSKDRDKRTEKTQHIEFDYLAPDTVNEIFEAIRLLEGLEQDENGSAILHGYENCKSGILVRKVPQAIDEYKKAIRYYGIGEIINFYERESFNDFESLKSKLFARVSRDTWHNVGGQLIKQEHLANALHKIRTEGINNWDDLHDFYKEEGASYFNDRLIHAYTSLLEVLNITGQQFTAEKFDEELSFYLDYRSTLAKRVYDSRAKDYNNKFKQMTYNNREEMDIVLGSLEDNSFIQTIFKELEETKEKVKSLREEFFVQ